ncbi:MAG: hypothetical protein E4G74_00155 [Erysipelotrichales bacterium]|nr:MAG: hypothetical protein E4G74_00155 [Erysipelotrichales bacterium]
MSAIADPKPLAAFLDFFNPFSNLAVSAVMFTVTVDAVAMLSFLCECAQILPCFFRWVDCCDVGWHEIGNRIRLAILAAHDV